MNAAQTHTAWRADWLSLQLRAPSPLPDIGLAQIYRNTVWRGLVDSLLAQFASVTQVMGVEWAQAAARLYLQQHPAQSPVLLDIGRSYAAFLGHFEHATDWPWLADLASCDWAKSRAHVAANAPPLSQAAWLGAIAAPSTTVLQLHPSCHWHWCEAAPIAQLWAWAQQPPNDATQHMAPPTAWHAQGFLVTRPWGDVQSAAVTARELTFIEACATGLSLQSALEAALDAAAHNAREHHSNSTLDLASFSAKLLRMGVFKAPGQAPPSTPPEQSHAHTTWF